MGIGNRYGRNLSGVKRNLSRVFLILVIIIIGTYSVPLILLSEEVNFEKKIFNVGLKLLDFEYVNPSGKKEIITTAIWYPSETSPVKYIYHVRKDFESKVVFDVPLAKNEGHYPLIIFSHGGYSCGYASAFFMEYLARHGYIVVAPDYKDTKSPDYTEQIAFDRIKGGNVGHPLQVLRVAGQFVKDMEVDRQSCVAYMEKQRLNPTAFILDKMIKLNSDKDSFLYQSIKEDAIGMCGHSLGGLTTIGKIGAHPDKRFKDVRIKAALIFSGSVYPFENTVGNIDIPIMLMTGDNDESELGGGLNIRRRLLYDKANSPKFYLILKNATHFAFSNTVCGETPLYQAVEVNPQAKAICEYGLAFFEKYFRGLASADEKLKKLDSAWAYYIKEENPGEKFELGKEPPPGTGVKEAIRNELGGGRGRESKGRRGRGEWLRRWRQEE